MNIGNLVHEPVPEITTLYLFPDISTKDLRGQTCTGKRKPFRFSVSMESPSSDSINCGLNIFEKNSGKFQKLTFNLLYLGNYL